MKQSHQKVGYNLSFYLASDLLDFFSVNALTL
jgi:hypothetical protein